MTTVHAYILEGASSAELQVEVRGTLEEAQHSRRACAEAGNYRTTEPVEMPANTDWDKVEQLIQSLDTMELLTASPALDGV